MRPVKKAALLHDLCGVGKAALTNMIPVLSIMGIEACPIPTILLSTHTGGYGEPAMEKVSTTYIRECADHYAANEVTFDMIFVGYLGSEGMIEAAEYFLSRFPKVPVILDPIMGDHGNYYANFNISYGEAMRRLLPYAEVILPNITEACLLTGTSYTKEMSEEALAQLCRELQKYGAKKIVITSVPCRSTQKGILLYEDEKSVFLEKEQLSTEFHGTGDTFDGVFAGAYLKGKSLRDSIELAHEFVCACLKESEQYSYEEREGLLIERNLPMLV